MAWSASACFRSKRTKSAWLLSPCFCYRCWSTPCNGDISILEHAHRIFPDRCDGGWSYRCGQGRKPNPPNPTTLSSLMHQHAQNCNSYEIPASCTSCLSGSDRCMHTHPWGKQLSHELFSPDLKETGPPDLFQAIQVTHTQGGICSCFVYCLAITQNMRKKCRQHITP